MPKTSETFPFGIQKDWFRKAFPGVRTHPTCFDIQKRGYEADFKVPLDVFSAVSVRSSLGQSSHPLFGSSPISLLHTADVSDMFSSASGFAYAQLLPLAVERDGQIAQ